MLQMILKFGSFSGDHDVLDLGCGTGNLSNLFKSQQNRVWGTDFSPEMITIAKTKFPEINFAVQDVREPLPAHFPEKYQSIVSAYVFHHFPIKEKILLIKRMQTYNLLPGGRLVIGDLMFADQSELAQTRTKYVHQWDEEYYWLLDQDLPLMLQEGLKVKVDPISFCAKVITIL
jgi:putative AdoMet-dependent methyltransferase